MSSEPIIAQDSPFAVELEQGKKYAWCSCGLSSKQPFCDGSHKPTAFSPKVFTAEESKTFYLCGCKRTGESPFCDGTHNILG
ncbi:MAG: CDGSH iron-sulfur domain-containing protein [SAR324 cluster bacterium]|nr:CDGSH iron-sulfur domain-containing protein [SAR324 cluster bacterium]